MNYDRLVNTAADMGNLLIENGAEISRAEESMRRFFSAYGVSNGEVFAIPTFISVSISTPDGRPITAIRRIPVRQINMDRVECANDLCRRICRTKPDFDTIEREMKRISSLPTLPFWAQAVAFALVAAAFTMFYGGTAADACVAFLCGAAIKPVWRLLEHFHVNQFFIYIAASFVSAVIAIIFAYFYAWLNYDKIIIGALMNLVPGIAITDFMRDIIAGDMIAGILRFVESILVAAAIAIGAGIALIAIRTFMGV
ncbi:MAG: Threonine/serine exporter [Thermocaproicibacter melissae]|jgi:uncharacterized membrane protein YjjP (DUF1212 family)|uniref:threonine/serine ThrE exporter family protein n=1 Tax=Thermocaproicibacter melissae TaxID=2966552 RepID=UPI0024B1E823|nr:threonine/serine exporter family protein [Thermocaproicibacter melissae]WBY64926.1 threonine/serine exporter family protein [Thermocaproicibacter melissae]